MQKISKKYIGSPEKISLYETATAHKGKNTCQERLPASFAPILACRQNLSEREIGRKCDDYAMLEYQSNKDILVIAILVTTKVY